jgi:selenocysteine lyase/cysteine desulfurase
VERWGCGVALFHCLWYFFGGVNAGSCEKTVHYLCDTIPGFSIIKIDLEYPISDDEIIERTTKALATHPNIKLTLMDAISSLPGVVFPWETVCALCRQCNIYSLVDAAHALTQIPINIRESQPDFFVSNLHKWSYVPRGCAVLYVRRELQSKIHSVPIGHGYTSTTQSKIASPVTVGTEGPWVTEHEWVGTQDFSGYLSVPAAFEFISRCGGADKIRQYCHTLAREGGKKAAEILGTEVLKADGACMVNVRLLLDVPEDAEAAAAQRATFLEALIEKDCFPYPFVMSMKGRKEWWCRFCAQIYLDLDDFETGARVLKEVCQKLQETDFSKSSAQANATCVKEQGNIALDPEENIDK